jgi:biopolymer transport protein ExbD
MGVRSKRKTFRSRVAAELELMPMLNVFITIIPLLLLSAAFVPVTVIQASLPAGAPAAQASDGPLELTVAIRDDAFIVEGNGLPARAIPRPASAADSAGVQTARAELGAALQEIAAARPDHREVRIVAEATTRYEVIIDVMDVARAAGLPDVALAGAEGW